MMNRVVSALVAPLCCVAALQAQEIRVGPFLQHAEPDSIWIVWETTSGSESTVEFGRSALLGGSAEGDAFSTVGEAKIHQVQLTGLTPDTRYHYRVKTGPAQSEVLTFRTPAPRSAEKAFRFVAYSDTQGGPVTNKHTEVINEGVIRFVQQEFGPILENELGFAIEPGDLVDNGDDYAQWKTQYFDEEQNLIQHVPLYPVPGNHERDSHWFFDYFVLPENGTEGYTEHWWYKDYSNVRIIGLDSNSSYRNQAQLNWLDGVLAEAATDDHIDFVFAQLHHPHLSEPWTPGNTPYTGEVVSRLESFSTDTGKPSIHFFGHTHAYSRGQSKDHSHLWVNVAAGEGAIDYWGEYPMQDYPEFARTFVDWGFVMMEVWAGDSPGFRLRRVSRGNQFVPRDNDVMDDITIRRYNTPPLTPTPVLPEPGTHGVDPESLELRASAFSDPDGDRHVETEFQLSTVKGSFQDARTVWIRNENWYAPKGASSAETGYFSVNTVTDPDVSHTTVGELEPSTTYYWRARYRDGGLEWSDWSDASSFTTASLPTGACCLFDGACLDTTQRECESLGGDWKGEGTDCDSGDCPRVSVLFRENFDGLALGPNVDETLPGEHVWTDAPPEGWVVDDSGVPSVGNPAQGVTEWEGWAFTDKEWWAQAAEDQGRSGFVRASATVAVADPDEWADLGNPTALGLYDARMTTPPIDISGVQSRSLVLRFNSAWQPEGDQTAEVVASFDHGPDTTLLRWGSGSDPDLHEPRVNEVVTLSITPPSGATSMKLTFRLSNAGNNWFWAIDNILVVGNCPADLSTPYGSLDIDDVLAFLSALASGATPSDITGDGAYNIDDVTGFLAMFASGCSPT